MLQQVRALFVNEPVRFARRGFASHDDATYHSRDAGNEYSALVRFGHHFRLYTQLKKSALRESFRAGTASHITVNRIRKFLRRTFGCRDVHRLLFEYAQGTLDPKVKERLDDHFRDCPACLEFIRTYRQTIAATRCFCACRKVEMPAEVQLTLEKFIDAKF